VKNPKEKLSLKVRLRRWWKGYKETARYKGWITPLFEDFFPFYDRLNHLYWWIRHRTINVYHKIDTGLEPGYYDLEILMLYSCFKLLESFVEEEYDGVKDVEKRIKDLGLWLEEELKDIPEEHRAGHIEANNRQADNLKEALALYKWWKEVYPKYEDNDPWMLRENDDSIRDFADCFEVYQTDKDGDPTLYEWKDNRTPEQRKKLDELSKLSQDYDERIRKETEDNLIRLIKLRTSLWT
jgi:hypothetical protein